MNTTHTTATTGYQLDSPDHAPLADLPEVFFTHRELTLYHNHPFDTPSIRRAATPLQDLLYLNLPHPIRSKIQLALSTLKQADECISDLQDSLTTAQDLAETQKERAELTQDILDDMQAAAPSDSIEYSLDCHLYTRRQAGAPAAELALLESLLRSVRNIKKATIHL